MLGIVPGHAGGGAARRRHAAGGAGRGGRDRRRADGAAVPQGRGDRRRCPRCAASTGSTCCASRARRLPSVACSWCASGRSASSASRPPSGWQRRASRSPSSTRAGCCRCPRPLVALAREHRLVVTVDDGGRHGGFGSALADALRGAECDVPAARPRAPQEFLDHGSRAEVLAAVGLTDAGRRPAGHRVGRGAARAVEVADDAARPSVRRSRHADASTDRRGRAAAGRRGRPWAAPRGHGGRRRVRRRRGPREGRASPATTWWCSTATCPGCRGDELCAEIVASGATTRVIMLTASGTLADKVEGLSRGADDYLAKPFDFPELVARVPRARPPRHPGRAAGAAPPATSCSTRPSAPSPAGPAASSSPARSSGCSRCCSAAGGAVVSSEELLERVWDENADPFTTTVRVTVMTLRKKLGEPGVIETVVGSGYRVPAPRVRPSGRATVRAPGRAGAAGRAAAPAPRVLHRARRAGQRRCCCGWAGCSSAGWRRPCRALPPGSTVRVGDRTCRPSRSATAVGEAARDEVLRAGLDRVPARGGRPRPWCRGGWSGGCCGPLHAVTATARRLSAESLDTRIGVRDARGEVAELAATFDAMLDRLQAAFDAQRRFVANASHELRTPLAVLRTEVDVTLADPAADVDELRRMGEVVREATRRAEDLVAGLLLLARTEAAPSCRRRAPVDLAEARRARAGRGARGGPRPRAAGAARTAPRRRRRGDAGAARAGGRQPRWRTRCGTTSRAAGWRCAPGVRRRGRRPSCAWRPAGPEVAAGPGGRAVRAVPPRPGRAHRRRRAARGWASRSSGRWCTRTAARWRPARSRAAAWR